MSKFEKDSLGTRMKEYEDVTRFKLPNRSYVLARIDGKAFHTYCKRLERPFDLGFIEDMNATAIKLCQEVQNVRFAYVQSDEISLALHEQGFKSQSWFQNNIQKMASVSASIATAEFNKRRILRAMQKPTMFPDGVDRNLMMSYEIERFKMAEFDARFWTVPSAIEVHNYFFWRQQDATRNSISSVAQSLYSHKELEGVNSDQKQELIFQKGINWNDLPEGQKRGRFIENVTYVNGRRAFVYDISFGEADDQTYFYYQDSDEDEEAQRITQDDVVRNKWEVVSAPIFSQDADFIKCRIINQ